MDGEDSALAIFGADGLPLLSGFRKYLDFSRSWNFLKLLMVGPEGKSLPYVGTT